MPNHYKVLPIWRTPLDVAVFAYPEPIGHVNSFEGPQLGEENAT